MINLDFAHYQEQASKTAIYPGIGANLNYAIMGLVGEAGELANHYAKVLRGGGQLTTERKEAIIGELGDLLWFVSACCEELRVSMGYVAWVNLRKLKGRQVRGVIEGDGDGR